MATVQSALNSYGGSQNILLAQNAPNLFGQVDKMVSKSVDQSGVDAITGKIKQMEERYSSLKDVIGQALVEHQEYNKSMAEAAKKAEEEKKKLDKMKESLQTLKDTVEKVSAAMKTMGFISTPKELFKQADQLKSAKSLLHVKTGMQEPDLEMANKSARQLYIDNAASTPEEAAERVASVHQMTGKTGVDLEQTTRAASLLSDTYGYDMPKMLQAAGTLQKKFGVEGAQAFDFIIQASQNGLNANGNLLETINKYSPSFQKMGFNAQEMFNMLANESRKGGDAVAKMGEKMKGFSEKGASKESAMALYDLNGSIGLTTDNLENLNNVRYDSASGALSSLAKTVNVGLAGTVGNAVLWVSGMINDFTAGLQGKGEQINSIFGVIGYVIGTIGSAIGVAAGFISDNWSVFEPILWGIAGVFVAFNAVTWAQVAAAQAMKVATALATVAQKGLNAAMAASPLTWILVIIVALVALFYIVIAAVNKFAGTSYSATGMICGAFAAVGAFLVNWGMAVIEFVFGIIEFFVNKWVAFANFFANVFNDPIGSIIHLFADLADTVLGVLEKIAQGLDFLFGTNFASTISGWRSELSGLADEFAEKFGNGKYEAKFEKLDMDQVRKEMGISFERLGYQDSYNKGHAFGEGFGEKAKKGFDGIKYFLNGGADDLLNPQNQQDPNASAIAGNTGATAANTAAMADSLDALDEELKYMREAAEQEIINRFTLAELKIDVNNNNTIKTKTDVEDMSRMLADITTEMLVTSAEGVNF